jgi:hypothetical protein
VAELLIKLPREIGIQAWHVAVQWWRCLRYMIIILQCDESYYIGKHSMNTPEFDEDQADHCLYPAHLCVSASLADHALPSIPEQLPRLLLRPWLEGSSPARSVDVLSFEDAGEEGNLAGL